MSPCFRPVNNASRNPYADLGTLLSLFGASPADVSSCHNKRSNQHVPSFIPNFDVIETPQAYILEGELPGLSDKRGVNIEFIDHQTLLVRGRISRDTTAATSNDTTPITSDDTTPTTSDDATPTTSTGDAAPEQASSKAPTVEEVVDEADSERSSPWTVISSSASDKGKNVIKDAKPTQTKTKPEIRYWVTERSTGFFQRNFKFPGPIDQDNVTAKFVDGILTIEVPKQTKVQTRKVEIQ